MGLILAGIIGMFVAWRTPGLRFLAAVTTASWSVSIAVLVGELIAHAHLPERWVNLYFLNLVVSLV